jgi:hypothetical protein
MKNTSLIVLLASGLTLAAACAGDSQPQQAETLAPKPSETAERPETAPPALVPPEEMPARPDRPSSREERRQSAEVGIGHRPAATEADREATRPQDNAERASSREALAPAWPEPLKTDRKAAQEAAPTRPAPDILARTEAQLNSLGIKLDEQQAKKLRAISSNYDFAAMPTSEDRRALRRRYMTEVFETVLTPEQQKLAREKRDF